MRTSLTLLLTLVLLSLASPGLAQPRLRDLKGKAAAANAIPEKLPAWDVKGRGETQEEAEKDALGKARALLEEYLRRRQPPLRWSPSPNYIRDHLVAGAPQRR